MCQPVKGNIVGGTEHLLIAVKSRSNRYVGVSRAFLSAKHICALPWHIWVVYFLVLLDTARFCFVFLFYESLILAVENGKCRQKCIWRMVMKGHKEFANTVCTFIVSPAFFMG